MAEEGKSALPSRSSKAHFTVTAPDGRSVESMVHEVRDAPG